VTQINDSVSGLITRTYDGLDRLTFESTPKGSITYTYDAADRRASMTVTGQSSVVYSYDNANRLTQITQGSSVVQFGYDNANRRTNLTLPNNILVNYSYDAASRVTGITYKQNGTTVLGDLAYEYDKAGNRTKVGGSFARTGIPENVPSTNYNAANQQTTFSDKILMYDDNGNLQSITDSNGTTLYSWNARNQLAGISGANVSATFVYDAIGRRQKKTINGNMTEFLHDGVNPVQETSDATVLANILTGLRVDEFFTRTDVLATTTAYLLPDGLRSALAITDSAGTVQTEYSYEPFGQTTATGVLSTNPFQYTDRENDSTGLYYYRNRYYHAALHRFISEDPIEFTGGDVNLYAYVGNNPIRFNDPHGLFSIPLVIEPVFRPGASSWDTAPDWHRNRNRHQKGKCPPSEPKCDPAWHKDTGVPGALSRINDFFGGGHAGFDCYRGTGSATGAQCCYKNGKLVEGESTYDYSPPDLSLPNHFWWDWLPGIIWGDYPKATPNL